MEQSIVVTIPNDWLKIESAKKLVQSIRHTVSRTHPTHALFNVSLSSHYAAVHLTICPFHIPQHQEQIFFSSFYHYSLCCTHSKSVITPSVIADYVQTIYDTYYQSGQWNFSSKPSYVPNKHEYQTLFLTESFGVGKPYVTPRDGRVSRPQKRDLMS